MKQDNILTLNDKTLNDAFDIAKKGTHCGMCRIDFLGTGLCPSGKKYGFVAYWPQGRMEIFKSLMSGKVKPTEKLIEIANSCTLCGICDKQCNFATQLRPQKVARALKEYVNKLDKSEFQSVAEDDILKGLREILGMNGQQTIQLSSLHIFEQ
ncbi:MAG: 4Fe-4S dicluster domain-containing protein [Thermoplasmatota archaeon]